MTVQYADHRDDAPIEDRRYDAAARKAIRVLLPMIILIYLLSYLDRTNVALAKPAFQRDLGIGPAAYGLGSGLFFIAYAFLEVPSNLLAYRIGPRRWIARIAVTWGIVSVAMVFVRGDLSFYVLRVLLGAAEAGLFPALLYLITSWFAYRERSIMVGWLYVAPPLAIIFGNPFGGLLMELNGAGGLQGWQWMFLIEGLPTIAMGVFLWFRLPDRPRSATWLNPEEAAVLERRAIANTEQRAAIESHGWTKGLGSATTLLIGTIYFLNQVGWNGLVFFAPGAIHQMNVTSPLLLGIVSSSIGIGALIGVLVIPRLHRRVPSDSLFLAAVTIGFLLCGLGFGSTGNHVLQMLFIVCGAIFGVGVLPVYWAVAMRQLNGLQAAAGLAAINTMGLSGGFVGPYLFGLAESWTGRSSSGFYLIAIASALALVPIFLLSRVAREDGTQAATQGATMPAAVARTALE
ncbi:MFS transporter [Lichenicoccus roseus]|uniref:MFS transporter n=1 Tax=Lichenicoccus roseus TaxID=2683649 RepID=A0A5R9J393_9PROT|nr:MFS transporter [Lichenicoccus roseus]TLU72100.1 MFS transporter [Lichenicoccus roseus]